MLLSRKIFCRFAEKYAGAREGLLFGRFVTKRSRASPVRSTSRRRAGYHRSCRIPAASAVRGCSAAYPARGRRSRPDTRASAARSWTPRCSRRRGRACRGRGGRASSPPQRCTSPHRGLPRFRKWSARRCTRCWDRPPARRTIRPQPDTSAGRRRSPPPSTSRRRCRSRRTSHRCCQRRG